MLRGWHTLGEKGSLTSLVLGDLVAGVLLAGNTVGATGLGDVYLEHQEVNIQFKGHAKRVILGWMEGASMGTDYGTISEESPVLQGSSRVLYLANFVQDTF